VTARESSARTILVRDSSQLRSALRGIKPGATVKLAGGQYRGGVSIVGVSGSAGAPITISAADEKNPPIFSGGNEALHLSDCNHLVLRGIVVRGFPSNGINIDDGGSFDTPTKNITIDNVTIENTGPKGNHDALKLSGLDNFIIRNSVFRGWAGSAIDMVGCHMGVVEGCRLVGAKGFTQSSGIQMKGGSADIVVRRNYFDKAGSRAINLGGSTGLQFFRPSVGTYEAKNITVAGNRFAGSMAPIACVTADTGHIYNNTFYMPEKWVLRILQETRDSRFKSCQGVLFERNLVVYDSRIRSFVNVGPGTRPETFTFRHNAWFRTDGSRKPMLPTNETGGVYQVDPRLAGAGTEKMKASSPDPRLKGIGADWYSPK
jgi:hypothetical protein